MASQARSAGRPQSKWVRPLVPLVIIAVVATVLLYLGGFIAAAQGATDDAALPLSRWLGVILAAAVILYGLYVGFAEKPIWAFGTREVVYAAIGAALYGVLGFSPGVIVAFSSRKRALDALTITIAVISLLATGLILANASFTVSDFSGNENPVGPLWWLPLIGGVLAVGARYLFARREDLAAAEVWGALGIVLGIGFAAFGGIIQNGTSVGAAFFGEFVPAAGSNLIN